MKIRYLFMVLAGFICIMGLRWTYLTFFDEPNLTTCNEEFPLEHVKRGLKTYMYTVFEDTKTRKYTLTVEGMPKHPAFSNERMILAYMEDEGRVVVHGMSGSPVYAKDGPWYWKRWKKLGALAWGQEFPLHKSIAGITPTRAVRNQQKILGKITTGPAQGRNGYLNPLAIPFFARDDRRSLSNARESRNRDSLREFFRESAVEFVPIQSPNSPIGMSEKSATPRVGSLIAGDYVIGFVSRGDVQKGWSCTVTDVTEKTFSICGHSFLGEGNVEIPAYRISVATIYESPAYAFKWGEKVLEPVGTLVYDNAFGFEGVREIKDGIMMPVKFSISVDGDQYEYAFEVFRHKFLSSTLIESNIRSLLDNIWPSTKIATAKLQAKIFLKNRKDPIEIYDAGLVSMVLEELGPLEGYLDPWKILTSFQQKLMAIQQSEWNLTIERVEIVLNIENGNRAFSLDSLAVLGADGRPTDELRPGEILRVLVGLRNENTTKKVIRSFTVNIPERLHLIKTKLRERYLDTELHLMSGNHYSEKDPKKLAHARPDSSEQFLRDLLLNQRDPSMIYAVLILPPEYLSGKEAKLTLPHLGEGGWSSVDSLEFLRERNRNSEPRVLVFELGTPEKNAVVDLDVAWKLKLVVGD